MGPRTGSAGGMCAMGGLKAGHHGIPPGHTQCIHSAGRAVEAERKQKERSRTGLSASAMGPRAVAGGSHAVGNHLVKEG
jgi:hypothetical protein